jgi:hypothetical protein
MDALVIKTPATLVIDNQCFHCCRICPLTCHVSLLCEMKISSSMGTINTQNNKDGCLCTLYINRFLKLHLYWEFGGCISNWFVIDGECRIDLGIDVVKHVVYCMHHQFNIKTAFADNIQGLPERIYLFTW